MLILLVAIYDLLADRRINDVTVNFSRLPCLPCVCSVANMFAVRLFSSESRKTSKCGKNIRNTLAKRLMRPFLLLPNSHVIWDLLLNRCTATWNLFLDSTNTSNPQLLYYLESGVPRCTGQTCRGTTFYNRLQLQGLSKKKNET